MDYPEVQITHVIRSLAQHSLEEQSDTLNDYFLPDAYFIHPFCRVPSFADIGIPFTSLAVNSRWLISLIYQWYRVLSPDIKLSVDSASFDKGAGLLYVTIRQTFALWFVPFSLWRSNVKLVTVLELQRMPVDRHQKLLSRETTQPLPDDEGNHTPAEQTRKLYFIKGQEDHYQVNEFIKLVAPWGASLFWVAWQLCATLVCAVGVALFRWPAALFRERVLGHDSKAIRKGR
ncbi:hypothetical protein GGS23DRAFT_34999 [Durotheca rogersii]|uniref:uncharacterized protein n=1 Tax=Durotheca rogersii TaxID=419775 RepID=UPI0022211A52|nr:uncharacterized protein GGS23DRAFT_34999 [Durotheca rogersii]KAI5868530.1 hypothetical protein GGS23DRAFT_34999 [Durotheca rogersii]